MEMNSGSAKRHTWLSYSWSPQAPPTLNICTPITANMNCSKFVTNNMLPMVLIATTTHCTTCYNQVKVLSIQNHLSVTILRHIIYFVPSCINTLLCINVAQLRYLLKVFVPFLQQQHLRPYFNLANIYTY